MAKTFTLLLLYNKMSASPPVTHALADKGINVLTVDKSADLANYIKTREIDMVGLSVSHLNVSSVAEVLKSSAKIPYFVFAEDGQKTTKDQLDASTAETKILGVASGYTIWKSISHNVKSKLGVQEGKIILSGMEENATSDDLGDVFVKKDEEKKNDNHVVIKTGEERFTNLGKVYTEDMKKLMDCVRHHIGRFKCHDLGENDSLGLISKVTAIIVGSHSEHGVLLLGSTKNEHMGRAELEIFLEKLRHDFKGLPFKIEEAFQVEVIASDVCKWARSHSLFTFIYGEQDHFASLLKCSRIFPELTPTDQPDMRSMRIEYLPIQEVADFDIYLYFNRNDKLLPFIKKGDRATDKINRMLNRELHTVYIKEVDRLRLHTAIVQDFVQGALSFV